MYLVGGTKYFDHLVTHWALSKKLLCYTLFIILILSGCTKPTTLATSHTLLNNKQHLNAVDTSAAQLIPQLGHSAQIGAISISHDGDYLLTGSNDGTAIVWNIENGQQIRRFFVGDSQYLTSVAFLPPDGRYILTGSLDLKSANTTLRTWDIETGTEIERLRLFGENVAISPKSGRYMATWNSGILYLWNTVTREKLGQIDRQATGIGAVAFSPDDKQLLLTSSHSTLHFFDISSKEDYHEVSHYEMRPLYLNPYLNPNDIFSLGLVSGNAYGYGVSSIALSTDGSIIIIGTSDGIVRVIEKDSFRDVCAYDSNYDPRGSSFSNSISGSVQIELSHDDKYVLAASVNGNVTILDSKTCQEVRRLDSYPKAIGSDFLFFETLMSAATFSLDGSHVVTSGADGKSRLWDWTTPRELRRFERKSEKFHVVGFNPKGDGRFLMMTGSNNSAYLWDLKKGQETRRFIGQPTENHYGIPHSIGSMAFSSDGHKFITGGDDGIIRLWDINSGAVIDSFKAHWKQPWNIDVALSTNDRYILGGQSEFSELTEAHIWDLETRREVALPGTNEVPDDDNSPDRELKSQSGELYQWVYQDKDISIWDKKNGQELAHFKNVIKEFRYIGTLGVNIYPGHNYEAHIDKYGVALLKSSVTGKELASLISFRDGNWAVVAPDGRYDSSSPGDLLGLSWVLPEEQMKPYPVEILMKAYYEPRLLPRLLAGEQFPPIKGIPDLNRVQPKVKVTGIQADPNDPARVSVTVEVASEERNIPRGGKVQRLTSGIQDLRLFRDGQLIGYTPEAPGEIQKEKEHREQVIVKEDKNHPGQMLVEFTGIRLPTGKDSVTFSAYAFNSEGVKSETHKLTYELPKPVPTRIGRAYILAIGVSDYQRDDLQLQFAAGDAQALQETLTNRITALKQTDLKQYDSVVPIPLINSHATKDQIKAVFAKLAGKPDTILTAKIPNVANIQLVTPDDLLIIAYSGHGYSEHGTGKFYLFPHDTGPGQDKVIYESTLKNSISTDDLSEWLRDVDAGEIVMIVDACNSSASVEGDPEHKFKPGPMGSRGFGQLAYDKAMRVLTASQAEEVAREFPELKHGILTYALIPEALDQGLADALPKDNMIRVGEWLTYGLERVPELNEQMGQGKSPVKGFHPTVRLEAIRNAIRQTQQPGLFDFARGHRDFVVRQLGK
jgi:WD40 repeat protein/uncharacterized caspase-like protein